MTTKREKVYYDWLQSLSQAGWNADKTDSIKFNSGSETARHTHSKLAVARVLKANDYRIDTEVEHPERGEIDIIAIPTQDDQKPFCVEVETSPKDDVVADKIDRYVHGTPFVECYIINTLFVPMDILEMTDYVADKLGLNI